MQGDPLFAADPLRRNESTGPPWRTLPLSVLLTPQGIVTLSQGTTSFLQPLLDGQVQGLSTARGTEFALRVFWQLADACLRGLREINTGVEGLEDELKRSIRNKEVLGLLDFQKSLTFFATGLKANELVRERQRRLCGAGDLHQHTGIPHVRLQHRLHG